MTDVGTGTAKSRAHYTDAGAACVLGVFFGVGDGIFQSIEQADKAAARIEAQIAEVGRESSYEAGAAAQQPFVR
jgi:hypothetical protein